MAHNHILGAWADYDGNVHYEYNDIEQLYPVDVFEYCPVCGKKVNGESAGFSPAECSRASNLIA